MNTQDEGDHSKPNQCVYQVGRTEVDATPIVQSIHEILLTPTIFNKIASFAPLERTSVVYQKLKDIDIVCEGGRTGVSIYRRGYNRVIFRFKTYVPHRMAYLQHICLHEFMHCLSLYTFNRSAVSSEDANAASHSRAFKRGLLQADFLLGLITDAQFNELVPLIDTIEPEQPYTFEKSYKGLLQVSTRSSVEYQMRNVPKPRARPNYATAITIKKSERFEILDLLDCAILQFKGLGLVNLLSVPTDIYVNDIVSALVEVPQLTFAAYMGDHRQPNQLLALLKDEVVQYVYINNEGLAQPISDVYAWWLLDL